ncbi:MAG: beta-lactamase family protein [Alphaproteobacteria bacterium]|nr:beta-lactamase family protein [Alphaproteobacteria bacterium]
MTATSGDAAPREASIDALFAPWLGAGTPGAVVGVSLAGRVVHEAGYGMASLAHGVPLDRRSVIRIGSQTKQFCVLLALMLAAEGRLDLDDEVQRHAPWLPRFAQRVTLRHLVTNTSGLRDFLGLLPLYGVPLAAGSTRADSRAVIAAHPELNFAPGSELLYSNSGFLILSEILESISGRGFDDLLQERICRPLGMRDTRLMTWDSAVLERLAGHHTRGPDGAWHRAHWGLPLGGEGGMVSTLDDLRIWLANLKRPTVGTPAMIAQLAAPATLTNGTPSPYAHGLLVAPYRGAATIGHSGGVAGGRSESVRFPDLDLDVIVIANCDAIPAFSMARRIADLCVGDRLRPAPPAPALDGADGFYRQEDGEDVFALHGRGEAMQFQTTLGAVPFRATGPDRFAPEKGAIDFELMARGRDGFDARWCGTARRYRRIVLAAGDAREVVGRWRATTGGLDAEIEADGPALHIRLGSVFGATRWPLLWAERDLLIADAGAGDPGCAPGRPWAFVLRVEPDALVLSTERVRAIRFRRA